MATTGTRSSETGVAALVKYAAFLFVSSLAQGSRKMYAQTIVNFQQFVATRLQVPVFPANITTVALYISYMIDKGYAVSTVISHISAISFFHKLLGFDDVTSHFIIRKMLSGAKKLYQSSDTRFPITIQILHKLVDSIHRLAKSKYEICLFKAMYILMFHGFLRIGEVTNSPNNIQYSQISVSNCSVTVTFVTFKHHTSSPVVLTIPANHGKYCPVKLIKEFL